MTGSVGQPPSSSSWMLSTLSPLMARRFRAKIPNCGQSEVSTAPARPITAHLGARLQLDPEEELLAEPRAGDVVAGVRHDPQPHAGRGGRGVHHRGRGGDPESSIHRAENGDSNEKRQRSVAKVYVVVEAILLLLSAGSVSLLTLPARRSCW